MKEMIRVVTLNDEITAVRLEGTSVIFARADAPGHAYKSKLRLDTYDRPYFISKGIRHYLYKQSVGTAY